jgi:hypothetical protein
MVRVPVSRIYAPVSIIEEETMSEPRNLTQKLLSAHLREGDLVPGEEIVLTVDQILIEDAANVSNHDTLRGRLSDIDTTLIPPVTQYGATLGKPQN